MAGHLCKRCQKRRARLCEVCAPGLAAEPRGEPAWTPFERATLVGPEFPGVPTGDIFVNSRYQVTRRREQDGPFGALIILSIRRLDRGACRDWRDFQRIKNELAGPETEAVELFPAESRLVGGANQYWIFCFPEIRFPFGFNEGRQITEEPLLGSVRRPFEEKPADLMTTEEILKRNEEKRGGKNGSA
jgi:hypothetical protein